MATGETRAPQAEWERLVALLGPIHARAAGMARRLAGSAADGDDLFQEAVLRALRALPSLRDANRFAPWFYTVLLSVHRNRARRSFWRRFLPLDSEEANLHEPVGDDGSAWEAERAQAARLSRALARLPAPQREAVVLFEIEGFAIDEIAALQRVSPSAVKSRLSRGRARLRRTYESWGFGASLAHADRGRRESAGRDEAARATAGATDFGTPALAGIPEEGTAWEGRRRLPHEGSQHD